MSEQPAEATAPAAPGAVPADGASRDGADARAGVRVGVLGPVAARTATAGATGGTLVEASGPRAKALLAALALAAPRPVSAERLTDEIWGDDPPRGARAALQTLVSRLRSSVGDELIESLPSGYRLTLEPTAIDLMAAEELLERARIAVADGSPDAATALAGKAVALWRGEPGADLDDGALADALDGRAAHVFDALQTVAAGAALALGRAETAEELARGLAGRAPFDDTAHLLLMRALDARGRSTEAVAVYAGFRERVQDAFGTSPDVELQALHLELLGRDAPAGGSDRSPVEKPLPVRSSAGRGIGRGIRAAPNALIGRETAVTAILALLEIARVTTILGPGGLGKTRVAHEVAARSLDRFRAVAVVELASVRSEEDVVFGIASALGIRDSGNGRRLGDQVVRADLRTRILNRLGETRTLLVLDNCEHVIEAAAEWCATLTAELPELTILTTSRTPLAISSERVFALAPLGAGETDDAVRLFLDRATAARQDAVLPVATVARLCARLDGLPLAIELAAARVRTMSIDEIERRLSNRFALLAGGDRSAPERHRTLLAVIEWSWNLLGRDEQRALARLSEFADGFGAEAAGAVVFAGAAGASTTTATSASSPESIEDLLDALVAQSLVMVRETRTGLRYRMLETVREFGQLQLERQGARDEVRDALFAWADDFSRARGARMDGREQVPTFREVTAEEDNLIDVLRRAIDAGRPDIVTSVFALLAYYWSLRSAHSEVDAFSRPVFDAIRHFEPAPDEVDALAGVLVIITATTMVSDLRFAVRPLGRLRWLLRTRSVRDRRLIAVAEIMMAAGNAVELAARVERAMASDDRATALLGTLIAGISAENDGDRDTAAVVTRNGARLAAELGDTWGAAMAAQMLAALASQSAEPEEALRWARPAREGLAVIGATEDLQQLDWVIGVNSIGVGNLAAARDVFERLVALPGRTDGVEYRSIGLAGQGELLRAEGRPVEGLARLREALDTFDAPRLRASPWFRTVLSETLAVLVLDGSGGPDEALRLARRLRSRTIATLRISPFADQPVLGASLVGLAVWLADPRMHGSLTADAEQSRLTAMALELLALAERMGAKQDAPGLHLAPLFARFRAQTSDAAVEHARAAAAALTPTERPGRAAAVLRASGPWSVRGA
ncbi:BTAD domain-containing putative transcriptional regulator [Herbiconiux solani]|uniref:BTAD domain-containing putative transcriptional regulator n=1 Tax=Herbiconiux solani TaxID=661329 RepID=UPI00082545A0|nr:BTAD domain-containing putative transcriptional regulator [Herbiconiux solani]